MGEYPPGSSTPKITLTFSKGGKKLWAHVLEHPVEKIAIIEKNGRSFFGLEDGEIRGYDRHGKRILTQYGKFLVASDGGRYIAFNPRGIKGIQGHPLIQVFGVDDGGKHELELGEGSIEELTDDGKMILVRQGPGSSSQSGYSLLNNRGKLIWERKQPCQFIKVEGNGKWILFATDNGKRVESCDLKSGKTVMVMPIRRYNALYNRPPPRHP